MICMLPKRTQKNERGGEEEEEEEGNQISSLIFQTSLLCDNEYLLELGGQDARYSLLA